jgi:hypothetical protein
MNYLYEMNKPNLKHKLQMRLKYGMSKIIKDGDGNKEHKEPSNEVS